MLHNLDRARDVALDGGCNLRDLTARRGERAPHRVGDELLVALIVAVIEGSVGPGVWGRRARDVAVGPVVVVRRRLSL